MEGGGCCRREGTRRDPAGCSLPRAACCVLCALRSALRHEAQPDAASALALPITTASNGPARPLHSNPPSATPMANTTQKGMLEGDDPRDALEGFNQVLEMEKDKGEW